MKKRKISLFDVILYLVFGLIALITIYPFYNVLIVSLANTLASATYSPYLYPHVFDLTGYKTIMSDTYFYRSLGTTLFVTIVGTTLNMVFSVTAAYVLSRKRLIGRKFFLSAILFTMLFSGGLIPTYLVVSGLGLDNSIWSMIFPSMISTYYLIIMKNYFVSLPASLEEAARIDGANEFVVMTRIFIPISSRLWQPSCCFMQWSGGTNGGMLTCISVIKISSRCRFISGMFWSISTASWPPRRSP
ncbi:MAG: carbohydrate ABC transporter permease [Eisenbergiella massiliensis]